MHILAVGRHWKTVLEHSRGFFTKKDQWIIFYELIVETLVFEVTKVLLMENNRSRSVRKLGSPDINKT